MKMMYVENAKEYEGERENHQSLRILLANSLKSGNEILLLEKLIFTQL